MFAKLWTQEEVDRLNQYVADGVHIANISSLLGRTIPAIESKYAKLNKRKISRVFVRNEEDAGPERPQGFRVSPEELDRLMAGRRFDSYRIKEGHAQRITAPTYVPSEASC